jgi:hypothetical protein
MASLSQLKSVAMQERERFKEKPSTEDLPSNGLYLCLAYRSGLVVHPGWVGVPFSQGSKVPSGSFEAGKGK